MELVQSEGGVSEVFLVLGPPEEALEHRPRVPREWRALGVGQPEVEAREHEPEIVAQLRGRVALGAQREGSDVERPRGRGGLPLQGLERVLDPRPWRTMSLPSGAVWRRLVDLFGQIRGASFKCELRRWLARHVG